MGTFGNEGRWRRRREEYRGGEGERWKERKRRRESEGEEKRQTESHNVSNIADPSRYVSWPDINFEDQKWKRYMTSLKPIGMNILLANCNRSVHSSYTAFYDNLCSTVAKVN